MNEIINEFKLESSTLVKELIKILDSTEDSFEERQQLQHYGQIVDRILGGAKSLALAVENPEHLDQMGSYAELCKIVGYKASQIDQNVQFYIIVHALLQDATEMLMEIVKSYNTPRERDVKELLSSPFLDRLRWVNKQFEDSSRGTLAVEISQRDKPADQEKIDQLMKILGI